MKVSQQWQAINDNQFWKHLPNDYKSHTSGAISTEKVRVTVTLSADEMAWLRRFRSDNSYYYPTLESATEALLTRIANEPMKKYLQKDYNKIPKSMKHEESFTMYIPKTLKERLTNPNGRRVLEVSRRLRFMIANSLQLSLHDYFEPLTKPKRKNKTRKEVL